MRREEEEGSGSGKSVDCEGTLSSSSAGEGAVNVTGVTFGAKENF